ncbi:MAG TPA: 4-hydroxy-tetrahydrodipicolinate reductase [Holophaga sp.]|nr:4-hydroxy-tetrahydrodipicolinate reductase [Holophaga sp.]
MAIKVCVAGMTGWTGSAVAKALVAAEGFELSAGIARAKAGEDAGSALGLAPLGLRVSRDLEEALATPFDVLVDFTRPDSVKARVLAAVAAGKGVVIGTSGLSAADYADIAQAAETRGVGVVAAGNFSITAALASHFAQEAARFLPWCEVIDYAHEDKVDAPSGTARELAEKLGGIRPSAEAVPLDRLHGYPEARGASIGGTRVHSLRLPGFVIAFETLFGLPHERLSIRHDAGSGAEPYVAGTLLAAKKALAIRGLVRGLDTLLFPAPEESVP